MLANSQVWVYDRIRIVHYNRLQAPERSPLSVSANLGLAGGGESGRNGDVIGGGVTILVFMVRHTSTIRPKINATELVVPLRVV